MKVKTIISSILTVGLLASGLVANVEAKEGEGRQAKAKFTTKAQAQKTIQRLWQQGKIKKSVLEEENGKLVWSFDILTPGSKDIIEAQVDALSGKVILVEIETPEDQAKEVKADATETKGKKTLKNSEKEDDVEKNVKESKKEGKAKKQIKNSEKEEGDNKDAKASKKEGKEKKESKKGKKAEKQSGKEGKGKKDKDNNEDEDDKK